MELTIMVQDSIFLLFRKFQECRFLEGESLVSSKICHMALDTNLRITISKKKKRQSNSVSLNFWICFLKPLWPNFQRSWAFANPPTVTAVLSAQQLLHWVFQRTVLENQSLYLTRHLFHGNAHIGHIRDTRFTTLLIPKKHFATAGWKKLYALKIFNCWILSRFHCFQQKQNHPTDDDPLYSHKSLSIIRGSTYSGGVTTKVGCLFEVHRWWE